MSKSSNGRQILNNTGLLQRHVVEGLDEGGSTDPMRSITV